MPHFIVDGAKMFYQCVNEGAKENILLVHSFLGNLGEYIFSHGPTLGEQYRLLMYDMRGHGNSECTKYGYTLDRLAEDMAAILDQAGIEKTHIATNSFGGLVALTFALKYPHRVDKLALVECPRDVLKGEQFGIKLKKGDDEIGVDETQMQHFAENFKKERTGSRSRLRRYEKFLGKTAVLKDMMNEKQISEAQLSQLQHQVLLVYGRESFCIDMAELLEGLLPNVTLKMLDGEHTIYREKAPEISTLIAGFLSQKETIKGTIS